MDNTNKYQRGKIYKITCNTTDLVYVGSTIEKTLANRLGGHRSSYKTYQKGKGNYCASYLLLENNNYDIELICNAPCTSKDELHAIESKYIREIDCVNILNPKKRTKEDISIYNAQKYKADIDNRKIKGHEYYVKNMKHVKQKTKQYAKDNAEKCAEYQKQYRTENNEKLKEHHKSYYQQNKEKFAEEQKQYRKTNAVKIAEYQKQYRMKNKEKIAEYKKQYKLKKLI